MQEQKLGIISFRNDDVKNNITEIKKQPGVWLLIGEQNGTTECLQVGQSTDIGEEIDADSKLLSKTNLKPVRKEYINYFGEKQFCYDDYPGWQAATLYNHIANRYTNLHFICIYGDIFNSKATRQLQQAEKYIAFKTKCRFWRNGKPFTTAQEIETITDRKNNCDNQLLDIRAKLDEDIANLIDKVVKPK